MNKNVVKYQKSANIKILLTVIYLKLHLYIKVSRFHVTICLQKEHIILKNAVLKK